jgi:cell wall-associated NlpC family hydrolase
MKRGKKPVFCGSMLIFGIASPMKASLLYLFLFLSISGNQYYSQENRHKPSAHIITAEPEHLSQADSLLCFAEQFLGKPYHYACASPEQGFDCSGFVSYVFKHMGIQVPRSSKDYEYMGRSIPKDSSRKGDVIVFTGTNAAIRHAGHVGIVISNPGEALTFIHSSSAKGKGNGVIISAFKDSPYYEKRFIRIVRILK